MQGNLSRFSGFAEEYDMFRPKPPAVLKEILLELALTHRPKLVVDLGSGTGLSTRYWADAAETVIGIEPNDDMRGKAAAVTKEANVSYRKGLSSQTGMDDGSADIVTCSQSLHWMEPGSTFNEVARILRPGGVFAAYDCDWPPTTGVWQADQAYEACNDRLSMMEERDAAARQVKKWSKHEHLKGIKESNCFRYAKEVVVHQVEEGNADRFVGLFLSQGSVQSLLKVGHTEEELGIDRFKAQCSQFLGDRQRRWYWTSRVRLGVK